MAVLWPSGVGKAESYVLWSETDYRYRANRGLDINNDGKITKDEAVQMVINRRDTYEKF
jgi:hypothetical protein